MVHYYSLSPSFKIAKNPTKIVRFSIVIPLQKAILFLVFRRLRANKRYEICCLNTKLRTRSLRATTSNSLRYMRYRSFCVASIQKKASHFKISHLKPKNQIYHFMGPFSPNILITLSNPARPCNESITSKN